jgi:hypothetical protein
VVGGGHLESCASITDTSYYIQYELFTDDFTLLQLKGYDIIFGCDLIKQHNPISQELRDACRELTIQKNGITRITFKEFTKPPPKHAISAAKLEKMCRTNILGYVIQINALQEHTTASTHESIPPATALLLEEF